MTITHYGKPIAQVTPYEEAPMTVVPERLEHAIHRFAERENLTPEKALERLIGYGLNAIAENDRYLESLKPRPYRIESCETYTDSDGEPALTEYVEIDALPTFAAAREALCGIVGADADTRAAITAAPLGHSLAIGSDYYRITKTDNA